MTCDAIRPLLAVDAAGLLDAGESRRVAEHVRECAACSAELEGLGALTGALSRQPAPQPPDDLVYRTRLRMAAEADRHQGARLALVSGGLAWLIALATWQIGSLLGGGNGIWIWIWWSTVAASLGSAAVAALVVRHRVGRSWL